MTFSYHNHCLHAEKVNLETIATQFGTPCYVYSRAALTQRWHAFDDAFHALPHRVCFAVKANGNLSVLRVLAELGSGFDIVSVGELERVLAAGGSPEKIVFSGVGKQAYEIERALEVGVGFFNVESKPELLLLNDIAKQKNKIAAISLRINPDIEAGSHPYISTGLKENKFGIPLSDALEVYQLAAHLSHIKIKGVACHIGSQILELEPFVEALKSVLQLVDELNQQKISIEHIDIGGGLGVRYHDEDAPLPSQYGAAILQTLGKRKLEILLEPGRAIVAEAGILLTKVIYLKQSPHKNFAVVDAGMNDLIRPALYDAWQLILPVKNRQDVPAIQYDVVGPVCETGDFLGLDRTLKIAEGDLLSIQSAGAYGFVMSSNYNARPRAAEVMVDGEKIQLVRRRETIQDLFAGEIL